MRDETLDDYLERNNLFLCRQLTDEEILEICDLGEWHKDEFAINFAKAILKKAQENG